MSELVSALGLVLVAEGLLYALAPSLAKRLAESVREMAPDALRTGGVVAVAVGVAVVWLARG